MKAVTTRNRTRQRRFIEFGRGPRWRYYGAGFWISIRLPEGPSVSGRPLHHALLLTTSDR